MQAPNEFQIYWVEVAGLEIEVVYHTYETHTTASAHFYLEDNKVISCSASHQKKKVAINDVLIEIVDKVTTFNERYKSFHFTRGRQEAYVIVDLKNLKKKKK